MKFAVKEKNYPPYHPPRVFKNSKYCMFNETRHVALVGGQSMAARPAAAAAVAPVFSSAVRHKIGSSSSPAPLQQPTNQPTRWFFPISVCVPLAPLESARFLCTCAFSGRTFTFTHTRVSSMVVYGTGCSSLINFQERMKAHKFQKEFGKRRIPSGSVPRCVLCLGRSWREGVLQN